MNKRMEMVEVETTDDGHVQLTQDSGSLEEANASIRLMPEQIDILIAWLNEARDEILGPRERAQLHSIVPK